jgi:predicted O-methyltransferase YrrM
MNQELWAKVDDYFGEVVKEDEALRLATEEAERAGLPKIAVSPGQGKMLMMLAQMLGAKRILEVGTLAGYSTIWLARGLAQGGRVLTLEFDPKHAEVARMNFVRAGLSDAIEVRLGDAMKTMPDLAKSGAGPFDLIFLDANKDQYPDHFRWALELSRKGTLIVADNVVRDGAVVDGDSKETSILGVRKLRDMIATEKRVTATAIQTVGSKGYDGFALIRVL